MQEKKREVGKSKQKKQLQGPRFLKQSNMKLKLPNNLKRRAIESDEDTPMNIASRRAKKIK